VLARTGNEVAAALAATWCGNIGYFGTILLRDILFTRRTFRHESRTYTTGIFLRNVRALLLEFGLAEALDSLLIRPALMIWLPRLIGDFKAGILAAKFAADITFYIPAIIFYEWSKKRYRDF
jgi:hypothetical protein